MSRLCATVVAVVSLLATGSAAGQEKTAAGLFRQAYDASQKATTIEDCANVVALCEAGLKLPSSPEVTAYGKRLAAWGHNKRGELLLKAEQPKAEEALADFEAAVKYDAQKPKYLHNRGVSYGDAGELEKAKKDFDAVLALDRNFTKAWFNRGEVLAALGDYAAAVRDYGEVVRRDGGDWAAYNARGYAYYKQKNYQAAISDYGRAVAVNPESHEAYTNRGDAYADIAGFSQAQRDYRRALQIAPKSARAHLSAAWFYATCSAATYRDGAAALESAAKAVELSGETWRSLDILAAAQARGGKYEDAAATQKKAIAKAEEAKATEKELEALRFRLSRYESDKAYVDVAPGTAQPE
ncbi:MAG: tetratricopeptide repeat protein [Planctomycetia bacterium]|nr:tetratricopeptide repeat protein [Planctomycetia bacterium]